MNDVRQALEQPIDVMSILLSNPSKPTPQVARVVPLTAGVVAPVQAPQHTTPPDVLPEPEDEPVVVADAGPEAVDEVDEAQLDLVDDEVLSGTVSVVDLCGMRTYGRPYIPAGIDNDDVTKFVAKNPDGLRWQNGVWTAFSEPYGPAAASLPAGHRRAPYRPIHEIAGEATAVHGCITTHPVSGIDILWVLVMSGDAVLAILNTLPQDAPRVLAPLGINELPEGDPFWSVSLTEEPGEDTPEQAGQASTWVDSDFDEMTADASYSTRPARWDEVDRYSEDWDVDGGELIDVF